MPKNFKPIKITSLLISTIISFFFKERILYSILAFLTKPSSDLITSNTLIYLYTVKILPAEPLWDKSIPISPTLTLLSALFHLDPGIKSLGSTSTSHLDHQDL